MRKCMFCGAGSLTKEDAWPLWLVRKFVTNEGVSVDAERGGIALPSWKQSGHFAKVRFVCASCNSGWMSQLENLAKPILESLLESRTSALTVEDQVILGRWSLKSAMVFEALRDNMDWFYRPEDRAGVRAGSMPERFTRIWIGTCVNLPSLHCVASDLADAPSRDESAARGYVTTLAFGTLAVQVMSVRLSKDDARIGQITTDVQPGPWDSTLLRVWPPTEHAQWPLAMGFDGECGVEALSRRFRPIALGSEAA